MILQLFAPVCLFRHSSLLSLRENKSSRLLNLPHSELCGNGCTHSMVALWFTPQSCEHDPRLSSLEANNPQGSNLYASESTESKGAGHKPQSRHASSARRFRKKVTLADMKLRLEEFVFAIHNKSIQYETIQKQRHRDISRYVTHAVKDLHHHDLVLFCDEMLLNSSVYLNSVLLDTQTYTSVMSRLIRYGST